MTGVTGRDEFTHRRGFYFWIFFFLSFLNNCVDRLTSIWSIRPGRVLRNSQKEVGGRESVELEYFYGHDGVNEVKGVISITCKLNYSLIRFIWEERRFNSTFCRKSQPQEWGMGAGVLSSGVKICQNTRWNCGAVYPIIALIYSQHTLLTQRGMFDINFLPISDK